LQENKKVMQLETALAMWQLLYADERRWQYIDDWCEFLQEHHKGRTVSKDTWAQLFEFARVRETSCCKGGGVEWGWGEGLGGAGYLHFLLRWICPLFRAVC
jgi:hypothetical protein